MYDPSSTVLQPLPLPSTAQIPYTQYRLCYRSQNPKGRKLTVGVQRTNANKFHLSLPFLRASQSQLLFAPIEHVVAFKLVCYSVLANSFATAASCKTLFHPEACLLLRVLPPQVLTLVLTKRIYYLVVRDIQQELRVVAS